MKWKFFDFFFCFQSKTSDIISRDINQSPCFKSRNKNTKQYRAAISSVLFHMSTHDCFLPPPKGATAAAELDLRCAGQAVSLGDHIVILLPPFYFILSRYCLHLHCLSVSLNALNLSRLLRPLLLFSAGSCISYSLRTKFSTPCYCWFDLLKPNGYFLYTICFNILLCIMVCHYRRGMDWWMDLLTTCTHGLELQAITAPPPTSTIHKSPQHPLSLFHPAVSYQPFLGNGF
jgi:hypothetical protein